MSLDASVTPHQPEPAEGISSPAGSSGSGLAMADHQTELYRILLERSETPADWYRGALIALADTSNPERFVHAAHSIRELMKKLHVFMHVARAGDPGDLGTKFRNMADGWEGAREASTCRGDSGWNGTIDGHLQRGLQRVDETVAWFRINRPAFRETSIALFRQVDVSPRRLPPTIEEAQVKRWQELYDYFNKVAHHSKRTAAVEFAENFEAAERFMLERLRPETAKEFARLDKLIEEAESAN